MSESNYSPRYKAQNLQELAANLFNCCGLSKERSKIVANIFVEADLLGYTTHGLNRIPSNLEWLEKGETRAKGNPQVLMDGGAMLNWDANYLPGPYVVSVAVDEACKRAKQFGLAMITIRRSQHIACLAAYLVKAVERGLCLQIVASTPEERSVSPYGGCEPVFSPNPFAFGAPTKGDPILIDFSLSIVAEGYVHRARAEKTRMSSACLKDHAGNVTDDPNDYWNQPRGSIMPIGGLDHGHKGYALCLWSELLTMALGNYGRADVHSETEANSVFMLAIDPNALGSIESFERQADFLANLCRKSGVKSGDPPVRIPGDRALALRRKQLKEGVELYPGILDRIQPWAAKFDIPLPARI